MKKIGQTIQGDIIAEMLPKEYAIFAQLAYAIEGHTLEDIKMYRIGEIEVDTELTSALNAIYNYSVSRMLVSELKERILAMESLLEKGDKGIEMKWREIE